MSKHAVESTRAPLLPNIDFVTLGMFIIDQIHFGDSEESVVDNVIGGAGTFGAIGARLFSPGFMAKSIGWIVDAGFDFPPQIRETLVAFGTRLSIRENPDRQTTHGWNKYGSGDSRQFEYLTPKKRLEVVDLIAERLVAAKTIHLICSPSRAQIVCREVCGVSALEKPHLIWEPVPDLCTPEHKAEMYKTLKLVQVISPNNGELAGFFGIEDPLFIDDPKTIQDLAAELAAIGIGPSGDGAVVVRAGKMGCLVLSQKHSPIWLPAYYQPQSRGENNPKVVDPTGGGNAFIGGLSVGLARHGMTNYTFAAAMGIVAASFAIEQVGIPVLVKVEGSEDEFWNGLDVSTRFEEYRKRVEGMGISLGRV